MSEGLNKVFLIGNLGADPELRMTAGGHAVLSFNIATNETYFDKDRVKKEAIEWHRIKVWGKRAEGLSRILTKGMRVTLEGRIHTSSYEKDGVKRYSTEIVVNELWLGGRTQTNGAMPRPLPPEPPAADLDIPF